MIAELSLSLSAVVIAELSLSLSAVVIAELSLSLSAERCRAEAGRIVQLL